LGFFPFQFPTETLTIFSLYSGSVSFEHKPLPFGRSVSGGAVFLVFNGDRRLFRFYPLFFLVVIGFRVLAVLASCPPKFFVRPSLASRRSPAEFSSPSRFLSPPRCLFSTCCFLGVKSCFFSVVGPSDCGASLLFPMLFWVLWRP